MSEDRQVWIVGDIEAGARAGDQRYHAGHCYVLDQVGNYSRKHKVSLKRLPESFEPCRICAPGRRGAGITARPKAKPQPTGVQPGHTVEVGDLGSSQGSVRTVRIAPGGQTPKRGEVSSGSPLGLALVGKQVGDDATYTTPDGRARKLRVRRFG